MPAIGIFVAPLSAGVAPLLELFALLVWSTLSAVRPDDPQAGGVACPRIRLVPDLCSQGCVDGDSGGGVEQNEEVDCETKQRHEMR